MGEQHLHILEAHQGAVVRAVLFLLKIQGLSLRMRVYFPSRETSREGLERIEPVEEAAYPWTLRRWGNHCVCTYHLFPVIGLGEGQMDGHAFNVFVGNVYLAAFWRV